MTQFDRLERDLAGWFSETAVPQTPVYLDDIFQQTARTRQRPRWTFIERLFPMDAATTFRASTQGVPWRTLTLLALLIVALVAGLVLVTGSSRRLPTPFGLARPGLIAYSIDGDIYTVDRASGQSRLIVAGGHTDINPEWSRDGTKLVFERSSDGGSQSLLFVVNSDGTDLTQITPSPVPVTNDVTGPDYQFSPDGTEVAFASLGRLQVARTDGSGMRELGDLASIGVRELSYRPSDGSQIALIGEYHSIVLADLDGGTVESLIPVEDQAGRRHPRWAPDGSALAYHEWFDAPRFTVRARVFDVETRVDRLADPAATIFWDGLPTWSNDGERLALLRGYLDGYDDVTAAVVAADGSRLLAETQHGLNLIEECCAVFEWAPDDRSILFSRANAQGRLIDQRVIDPATGAVSEVSWSATSDPAWQRLAE